MTTNNHTNRSSHDYDRSLDPLLMKMSDQLLDEIETHGTRPQFIIHRFTYYRVFEYAQQDKINLFYITEPCNVEARLRSGFSAMPPSNYVLKDYAPWLAKSEKLTNLWNILVEFFPRSLFKLNNAPLLESVTERYQVPPEKAQHLREMIKNNDQPTNIVDYILT